MGVFDTILNVVALLLWLSWRSIRYTAIERSSPLSLASTLKKAEPSGRSRWVAFIALVLLVGLRGFFYWNLASAFSWTPSLNLAVVTLPFRSDYLNRVMLFSILSFVLVLVSFYTALLFLSVLNSKVTNEDPIQKLVRLHLGPFERLPGIVRLLLPFFVGMIFWLVTWPALVRMQIVPQEPFRWRIVEQALLIGLSRYLSWKYFLVAICCLYLINSYVYLGKSYLWKFIETTGTNLLRPLRRIPLRIGRVDFSPLLGVLLVLLLCHWIGRGLLQLFKHLPG